MLLLDPLHVAVSVCYTFIVAVWTKMSNLRCDRIKKNWMKLYYEVTAIDRTPFYEYQGNI